MVAPSPLAFLPPSRTRHLHPFAVAQIVKPLWEPFVVLFPELAPLLRNLKDNCEHYFQVGERLEQERISAADDPAAPQSRSDNGKSKSG